MQRRVTASGHVQTSLQYHSDDKSGRIQHPLEYVSSGE